MRLLGKEYDVFQYGNLLWITRNLDVAVYGSTTINNVVYYPYSAIDVINFGCGADGWHVPTEADAIDLMWMVRTEANGCGHERSFKNGFRIGLDYNGIVDHTGNLIGNAMFGCFLINKFDYRDNSADMQLNYVLMTRGADELTFGSCYKRNKVAIRLCKKV